MVVIEKAVTANRINDVASLMRAFSKWAVASFHADDDQPPNVFEKLDAELANLPGRFSSPDGVLLVALLDDRVVGCLGGAPLNAVQLEASRLWVEPSARGQNVGSLLVQKLIEHAYDRDFDSIVLRSHQNMIAAHQIYQAEGFVSVGADQQFEDLQPFEIAMTRLLKPAL